MKFYHLMNKDNTMARFHIDGEGLFETVIVDYYDKNQPFKWITEKNIPYLIKRKLTYLRNNLNIQKHKRYNLSDYRLGQIIRLINRQIILILK